ncbi:MULTISPECIES: arginine--tRNA ligase [unclassified Fusibacter]|uniref:arginine--tRNA ligase n=1 Tax=unclassified Fusibacter TaxID=2624464 RepID=UPI0010116126|nr:MULTISPECIES: arginine--tRNA ligase [unclassified Fusibacter]MCK8060037.1 arginine--tRNA ligase [Fusibacter sp. A2]NPE22177.1 arginine--tRNA ligase [Fusibacter sp. A1]RXV60953.1 arginine--tRNA ligase [Fusibacter sp. A1]
MMTVLQELSMITAQAFEEAGVSSRGVEVTYSRRPDLCDFQCSSAMKLAKESNEKPIVIARKVVEKLETNMAFKTASAQMPGFVNLTLSDQWLAQKMNQLTSDKRFGCPLTQSQQKLLVDYGGANVAKSLHVGHLRSAVIGESLIRMLRFKGHHVTGDIHMGDWGLQIGYVIEMVRDEGLEPKYFDGIEYESYPMDAPFDITKLTELYTCANAKSKVDEAFRARAAQTTADLQKGNKGYLALWKHILDVSIPDLKKNYSLLQVNFDLWLGESDSDPAIPTVLDMLKQQELLVESEGAMVVHVKTEADTKPMPPCIMQKSNGASLYATTDLATIYERVKDKSLDGIVYVVDKRQDLHFELVMRVAKMAGIVEDDFYFKSIGFGTMNGTDGKPFKTRDGGVMQLGDLIEILIEGAAKKMDDYSHVTSEVEKKKVALAIGVGALKFADLSSLLTRDYVFDIDQFASFEGKTGPYVQYAGVRIASILEKLDLSSSQTHSIEMPKTKSERELMMKLAAFGSWFEIAVGSYQPSKICDYAFELSQAFNVFYHEVHVMSEPFERKQSLSQLLKLTKDILEKCLWLLGIESLEKM